MADAVLEIEQAHRTYTHNGHTFPISYGHLPDEVMAGRVRMLMRDELMHEAIVVGARDRILCLAAEKAALVEALQNAKGFLDTPISRRRNAGDSFFDETVKSINAALELAKAGAA